MAADRWVLDTLGLQRPSAQPYQAPAMDNPYTAPADLQRERISGALGWDVGPTGWNPAFAQREYNKRITAFLPLMSGGGRMSIQNRNPMPVTGPLADEARRGRAIWDWWANRRRSDVDPLASLAPASNDFPTWPIEYTKPMRGK